MSQVAGPRPEPARDARTIADLLPRAAMRFGDAPALRHKTAAGWTDVSYRELETVARDVAGGLIALGVAPGDRVAILAETRPEWTYANLGSLGAGAISVAVYATSSAEESHFILAHSESRVVFVEDGEQLAKVRSVAAELPLLEHVVVMAPDGGAGDALSLDELRRRGRGHDAAEWVARVEAVQPDDACGYIYTSGTTGRPKACVLSHENFRAMAAMAAEHGLIGDEEVVYLFLPLAHAFGLLVQFLVLDLGGTLAYWERDPRKIVANLGEVRPTTFPSVPRVFEKAQQAVIERATAAGGPRARLFSWSLGVGRRAAALEREGRRPSTWLRARHAVADRLVLGKVRALFGDRLVKCLSGAAPISVEVLEFFHACGVKIMDAYGLTETAPGIAANQPQRFRFGSVGAPFPGVEVRVADDGELLVRGPNVFKGYYKDDEATRRALVEGWFHTGDLGHLDSDGFLHVTGRKKDIIVTAGGKNVAPAELEGGIKDCRWVSEAIVVGDRRPYLVALVALDSDQAPAFASQHGLEVDDVPRSEAMRAEVQRAVDAVNARVGPVAQVKRFAILPAELSQERGELTATLKVKRAAVAEKHHAEVERLYSA